MKKAQGFLFAGLVLVFMTPSRGMSRISGNSGMPGTNRSANHPAASLRSNLEAEHTTSHIHTSSGAAPAVQNFDWTKNTILHLYFTSPAGKLVYNTAPPPMYDNSCLAFDNLFEYPPQKIDTYPEEGWVLLYKDFGDSTRPAAGNPIFILYNKYRGLMRVFFWNATDTAYTYGVMRLDIAGTNSTSMATFNSSVPGFSDQYNGPADGKISLSSIFGIAPLNWCYADFNLTGYDPDISYKDCYFRLSVYGIDAASFNQPQLYPLDLLLNSFEFVNIELPGSALTTSLAGLDEEVTNIGALSQRVQQLKNNTTAGSWFARALTEIDSSLSASSASWIPKVSSLAGRVRSFAGPLIGSDEFYTTFSLDMRDSITLQNTILTVLPRVQFPLIPVPGSVGSRDTVAHGSTLSYFQPLGIFNLKTQPVIGYCFKASSYQANSGNRPSYLFGDQYFGLDSTMKISYNPSDGLTLISARAAFVDSSNGPYGAYYAADRLADFKFSPLIIPSAVAGSPSYVRQVQPGGTIDHMSDGVPTEIALQLEFSYFNSLFGKLDTVYFLKTYNARLVYDPSIADRVSGSPTIADSTLSTPGNPAVPAAFLIGNYPNPFNPTTNVEYQIGKTSKVTIEVYDLLGQVVAVLADGIVSSGTHTAVFDGTGFASGVYLLRLVARPRDGSPAITSTGKMLLLK